MIDSFRQDLSYALRGLRDRRGVLLVQELFHLEQADAVLAPELLLDVIVDLKLFAHRFHDEAEVYRPIDARQENRAKAANASVPASAPKAVAGVSFPRSASAG